VSLQEWCVCACKAYSSCATQNNIKRFDGYESEKFTQLAIGGIFNELNSALVDKIRGKDELKFAVYAAHDTTLSGIL